MVQAIVFYDKWAYCRNNWPIILKSLYYFDQNFIQFYF